MSGLDDVQAFNFYKAGAFTPDGRLELALQVDTLQEAAVLWVETPDLGLTWSEPQRIGQLQYASQFLVTPTHFLVLDEWRFENSTFAIRDLKTGVWTDWLTPLDSKEKCREFGPAALVAGRILAPCALLDYTPGTISYSSTRAVAVVEVFPGNATYRTVASVAEPTCFDPFSLVPLPDGRFFMQAQCERDVGKPVLVYVMLAWAVDLANDKWEPRRGPLGNLQGFDGSDSTGLVATSLDRQGLVHTFCWCETRDPRQDNLYHEVSAYVAWNPWADTAVTQQILADWPAVGNDPAGLSPLPRAYSFIIHSYARGGPYVDGSVAVLNDLGILAWNTETGIALQRLAIGGA